MSGGFSTYELCVSFRHQMVLYLHFLVQLLIHMLLYYQGVFVLKLIHFLPREIRGGCGDPDFNSTFLI